MIRSKHDSINRHDSVERGLRKWKLLGVPFEEFDGEVLGLGRNSPTLQQGGNIVDSDGLAPTPRGGQGSIAASGCNIQYTPTCLEASRLTEQLGLINNSGRHDGEVTAGPSRLLPLFH